jgi:hypothetical protein
MPHEAEFGLFAFTFAEQARFGIGGGGVSLVQTPFAVKIHFRVTTGAGRGRWGVLGPETFHGGPGLDEGPVDGEMFIR